MRSYIITSLIAGIISLVVVFVFCCFVYPSFALVPDSPSQKVQSPVHAPEIPHKIDFSGESVPLDYFDVRESLDRELSSNVFFHSNIFLYMKRAARWFPVIEPILKENGIPDDFKYLALIESNLMNVVSPSGAAGFWQFLEKTGLEFGLEINSEIDERYHVELSTRAACRYFKQAYVKFGTWTNVAASYNVGMTGFEKQLKGQKISSYYDLWLNEETSRYVFRILAVKLILSDPEKYGFHPDKKEFYRDVPCKTVEVTGSVTDWTAFAFKNGTNYKLLKLMNPWIRGNKLVNVRKKTYQVKIADPSYREVTLFPDQQDSSE